MNGRFTPLVAAISAIALQWSSEALAYPGFIRAGYILKGNSGMFAAEHARTGFPERHGGIIRALRLTEDEPQDARHDQDRHGVSCQTQEARPRARRRICVA